MRDGPLFEYGMDTCSFSLRHLPKKTRAQNPWSSKTTVMQIIRYFGPAFGEQTRCSFNRQFIYKYYAKNRNPSNLFAIDRPKLLLASVKETSQDFGRVKMFAGDLSGRGALERPVPFDFTHPVHNFLQCVPAEQPFAHWQYT